MSEENQGALTNIFVVTLTVPIHMLISLSHAIRIWSSIGMIMPSVCLSVCLWHSALWLKDTSCSKSAWTS